MLNKKFLIRALTGVILISGSSFLKAGINLDDLQDVNPNARITVKLSEDNRAEYVRHIQDYFPLGPVILFGRDIRNFPVTELKNLERVNTAPLFIFTDVDQLRSHPNLLPTLFIDKIS